MPSITGAHHAALTVTDADRSAGWYSDLLGMQVVMTGDDQSVKYRVLAHAGSGWLLGIRQYPNRQADSFDEFRTGLDHLAFCVASRAELEEWERELSRRGIAFSPIAEMPIWIGHRVPGPRQHPARVLAACGLTSPTARS
jgi:glyoxylase I family protein